MRRIVGLAGIFAGLMASAPFAVCAETNPFFESNAARTVFDESAEVQVGGKIPESFKAGGVKQAKVIDPTQKQEPGVTVARALSGDAREKIKAEFGDPTTEVPLRTIDNAPTPFKGMMAALDAGDEGLAQQYAEQFQRYTEKLQRSNISAVNILSGVARQRELDAAATLKTEERDAHMSGGSVISPGDYAKLKQTRAEGGTVDGSSIPMDPEGKVQVFFFFNSNDMKSGAAAREVDALAIALKSDSRVQVIGVSADMMGSQAALAFKQRYELSIPVVADTPLANSIGVQSLPSIALMSPTTKRVVLKEGLQTSAELKRLVREIQGGTAK